MQTLEMFEKYLIPMLNGVANQSISNLTELTDTDNKKLGTLT